MLQIVYLQADPDRIFVKMLVGKKYAQHSRVFKAAVQVDVETVLIADAQYLVLAIDDDAMRFADEEITCGYLMLYR